MARSIQYNKGQDISLSIYPDDVIDFEKIGEGTAGLSVLLYPTGIDLSVESNHDKIKVASIGAGSEEGEFDGTISLPSGTLEYAICVFPYTLTSEMSEGAYSIEVVYAISNGLGSFNRTVMKNDNAFTLVESAAHYKGVKNTTEE